jgi:hypothetical protein
MLTWSFTNIMSTCPNCLKFVPLMRTYHLLIPTCSFGTLFVSNDFGYYGHNCTLWCLATFQAMIEHPLQIFCVSNIGTKPITTHAIIRSIFFNLHIYIYIPFIMVVNVINNSIKLCACCTCHHGGFTIT